MDELRELTVELFKLLDYTEESDEGRTFHPVHVSCCRALMVPQLEAILVRMKRLSRAPEPG